MPEGPAKTIFKVANGCLSVYNEETGAYDGPKPLKGIIGVSYSIDKFDRQARFYPRDDDFWLNEAKNS